MSTKIKNMTQGRPLPLIVSFALPLMLGNVFQQLYTVVDTMVVGKVLGVSALAAIGAADWLNWLVLGMIQGLTQGFAILMAREFGAGRFENLRKAVGASATLSAVGAVVLLAVGLLAARPILVLMDTPDEILGGALLYLYCMYGGIPIVMAYNLFACILRSLGDGKTPLNAMILASFVNIALDLLFVLVFHWGIAGAAVATLIAQLFSALFCLRQIRQVDILLLKKHHFRVTSAGARELLLLGSPVALQNALIAIGGLFVQRVVNGSGVFFIAGFTATNKLFGILEIAASSYGYAMITFAGQNLGAGKPRRIRQGTRCAAVIAVVTSMVISAAMLIFGKAILSLFISGTPEEIARTMEVAYFYLSLMAWSLAALYILHVTRSCIQGMGNTFLPMLSSIAEIIMRVAGAILMPILLGEMGILYAEVMAWFGAAFVLIPSYFVTIRKLERRISHA